MAEPTSHASAFAVKDCALAAIATGMKAQTLRELRDHIQTIHPGAIYYHFWGRLLLPRFDNPEYPNDFAEWAAHGLHDQTLAERLGVIDPTEFDDLEALREEMLNVLEERLDEVELAPWSKQDRQFGFIRSQIVVFDTNRRISEPRDLVGEVARMSVGSVFYHFIDARRRTERGEDDFRSWLEGFGDGHADLVAAIASVDPFFETLTELRRRLVAVMRDYFGGEAATALEGGER